MLKTRELNLIEVDYYKYIKPYIDNNKKLESKYLIEVQNILNETEEKLKQIKQDRISKDFILRALAELRILDLKSELYKKESYLSLLLKKFPENKEPEEILSKVCSISMLYHAPIQFDEIKIVNKILSEPKFDVFLGNGDINAVNKILEVKSNSKYMYYSFATKYCHWHFPDKFPIYDSRVKCALEFLGLNNFNKQDYNDWKSKIDLVKDSVNSDIHDIRIILTDINSNLKDNIFVKEFLLDYKILDKYLFWLGRHLMIMEDCQKLLNR